MVEREASGDFDYLFDDPTDADDSGGEPLPDPADEEHTPPDDDEWDNSGSFDAFDESTWYFEPAPTPWYRTRQAMTALVAVSAAAVALVVSGVLLVFQSPDSVEESTSVTPTAPTSAAPSQLATSAPPPPPPAPPPPPPETSAAPAEVEPVQTYRPRSPSRTTKEPEIGVTRTPATRSPISVAPQRPGSRD